MSKDKSSEPSGTIGLQQVVSQLRAELAALVEQRKPNEMYFELGEIDVELQVGVTTDAGGNAKAKFWVLELGADGKYSKNRTQVIRLKLTPKLPQQRGSDGIARVSE